MSEMLCLNHICVSYGSRQILHGIDLSLQPGEFCALLGLNGSGKSTLLHGLCGFLPMAGQVQVNGIDCTRMHEKKRAQLLSFLPQTPSLAGGRTTLDAVLMGYNAQLGLFDSPSAAQRQNALAILGRFGLADRADVDFGTLSQGQKQLVLLARSMVQEAPVMLMDEPDSALDFTNRHYMLRLIRDSIHSQQHCGLITLHDPNFAMAYCDRLVLLHGGVIQTQITMASASAEELREQLSLLYGPVEVLSYGGRFFMVEKADL